MRETYNPTEKDITDVSNKLFKKDWNNLNQQEREEVYEMIIINNHNKNTG